MFSAHFTERCISKVKGYKEGQINKKSECKNLQYVIRKL